MSIKISCDTCGTVLDAGCYVSIKTWGTFTFVGYLEQTIHVCNDCNKVIQDFVSSMKVGG